jgi:hypothetical protein
VILDPGRAGVLAELVETDCTTPHTISMYRALTARRDAGLPLDDVGALAGFMRRHATLDPYATIARACDLGADAIDVLDLHIAAVHTATTARLALQRLVAAEYELARWGVADG